MAKNKNFAQTIVDDRKAIMIAGMLASMEVLKDEFGFNQEQLNKFAEKYTPALNKNLKGK